MKGCRTCRTAGAPAALSGSAGRRQPSGTTLGLLRAQLPQSLLKDLRA